MGLYLDYNASTPLDERVLDKMVEVYREHYGNADSRTHSYGSAARSLVEEARSRVGELLGVSKRNVYFTSGSTESNNLAILGLENFGNHSERKHILTTAMEHKSVLEPLRILEKRGFAVEYIHPHRDGRVCAEEIFSRVRKDTLLVSVMHVNNETGTIQPVEELGKALADTQVYFHVDASQSCGKLVEELQRLSCDLLSVSAHKMYGPQGIGALIARDRKGRKPELEPIMYGGGQEGGLRPGTLPVALIAGFGEAAAILQKEYRENQRACLRNRERILHILEESGADFQVNGDLAFNCGNTLNISFRNYDSEALMLAVRQLMGISNGSACTSHSYEPSYVLRSMGLEQKRIEEAVRISWGREEIDEDVMEKVGEMVVGWQR